MTLSKENWNSLTAEESYIIELKGTEYPNSGEYNKFSKTGTFVCRRCAHPLYLSSSKFDSGCGWPSFDDNFETNVKRIRDKDGYRIEIVCGNCDAHLGHVFEGEKFTEKNTRHCVNSLSIKFIPV